MIFHHSIAIAEVFVEGETILKAGATAAGNEHPQHQTRVGFLFDQRLDLQGGGVGEQQRVVGGGKGFGNGIHGSVLIEMKSRQGLSDC